MRGCRPRPLRATTDSRHGEPIAPNLLERDFAPTGSDQVWASDITYIRTWAGWIDLPVVIDLWSRRVIGWSVADHMRIELVLDPFEMAVGQRVPEPNLIHHSDRGARGDDRRSSLTAPSGAARPRVLAAAPARAVKPTAQARSGSSTGTSFTRPCRESPR